MGVQNSQSEFDDNTDQVSEIQELESAILAQDHPCCRCRMVPPELSYDARSPHPTYTQQLYTRVWTLLEEYMQNNLVLRGKMQEIAAEIDQLAANRRCFAEHGYY